MWAVMIFALSIFQNSFKKSTNFIPFPILLINEYRKKYNTGEHQTQVFVSKFPRRAIQPCGAVYVRLRCQGGGKKKDSTSHFQFQRQVEVSFAFIHHVWWLKRGKSTVDVPPPCATWYLSKVHILESLFR